MKEQVAIGVSMAAGVASGVGTMESVALGKANYHFQALDKDGNLLWEEEFSNLVTSAGKDDALNKYFKGSAYTAAWYVGLKGAGSISVGDTMSSHAGWSEVTGYTEAARPTLTLGTVSGGSVSNTASKAAYSINSSVTIAGAFLTTVSTKGGTTGTLYSVGDFAASRTLGNGDSLQVTITLTAA